MRSFGEYKTIEFSSREENLKVQEKLLREHLEYCQKFSPFYQKIFQGMDFSTFSLQDIGKLPLTDKSDISKKNFDFLAVPFEKIVDIVLSSGTTGVPTQVMYTESDLQRLAYNEEKSFAETGLQKSDVVLLTCTLDRCFIAGLAYFLGIRSLGGACIRNGHGSLESHLEIIQRIKPTAIVGVPTFLRKLGEFLKERGINPSQTPVQKLICIGEPLKNQKMEFLKVGSDIESLWDAKAYSTYASSETVTTFCECSEQKGGHLHTDLALVEIVDENGTILSLGKTGEIVVTTLGIEGMPLVRFKTGDISFLIDEPCSCGRCTPRLGPILGRKKQMMKVKGTTLYPQAIFSALEEIPGMGEFYLTVESEDTLSDLVTVYAALKDEKAKVQGVEEKLQAKLRVKPRVVLLEEEEILKVVFSANSRKAVRFFDKR